MKTSAVLPNESYCWSSGAKWQNWHLIQLKELSQWQLLLETRSLLLVLGQGSFPLKLNMYAGSSGISLRMSPYQWVEHWLQSCRVVTQNSCESVTQWVLFYDMNGINEKYCIDLQREFIIKLIDNKYVCSFVCYMIILSFFFP